MSAITLSPGLFLNMNLLQVFLIVAEHRSFKEAARRTGRSHSAISAQIRQLEAQLETQLLHRTTRSVALTPSGETLLHAARQSLRVLDQGLERLRDAAQLRQVSFACTGSMASSFMPQVLGRFRSRHPGVKIEMVEMKAKLMVDPVLSGRFAFGIGPVVAETEGLMFEPLLEDPLVVVLPSAHPLVQQGRVGLEDLDGLELMLPMQGSASRAAIETAAETAGITLNVQFEGTQFYTLKAMVRAGLGVAVLPGTAMMKNEPADLIALPIALPDLRRPIFLITNPAVGRDDLAAAMIALIRREAKARAEHAP